MHLYNDVLIYSFFLYLVFILLIYFFVRSRFKILNKKHKSECDLYNLVKDGKTGDIILVSYEQSCGLIKIFSNSKWTHTALLYRDKNDNLFILECGSYKSKKYCGVNLVPFKIWLRLNKKSPMTWIRIKKPISNDKVHYVYQKYKKSKFNGKVIKLISALKNKEYEDTDASDYNLTREFFCSQFIMTVLQETKVVEKVYKPCSYSPNDFYIQKHEHIDKVFKKPIHLNFKY